MFLSEIYSLQNSMQIQPRQKRIREIIQKIWERWGKIRGKGSSELSFRLTAEVLRYPAQR